MFKTAANYSIESYTQEGVQVMDFCQHKHAHYNNLKVSPDQMGGFRNEYAKVGIKTRQKSGNNEKVTGCPVIHPNQILPESVCLTVDIFSLSW